MAWRVLVADDDPGILSLIERVLGQHPFEVTLCDDAESALVRLQRSGAFDILISDFMLPGISGLDLIRQVRNSAATANLPIVMISGHGNYAMDARAKSAGANAFLRKPFTLSQLKKTVQQLLVQQPRVPGAGG
jgi:CheY-like chemotaxis protein